LWPFPATLELGQSDGCGRAIEGTPHGLCLTYTLFIRDERYTVPTMAFLDVANLERAAQLAKERLVASRFHVSVELCREDKPLAHFDRDGVVWMKETD
jgi:hypothetical protein